MAGRSEELAKKFEAKAAEATAVFEKLSDADWKKKTRGLVGRPSPRTTSPAPTLACPAW